MSSKQPSNPHPRRPSPQTPPSSRASIAYIVVAVIVVVGLIGILLSTLDWGGLFSTNEEPTPDYNTSSISAQQTVVASNPDDVEQLALLASMLANSGRMTEAIPIYEQALDLQPDNARIRLDFARSLQVNGMQLDAEAQFLKVLSVDPRNYTAHYYLARLYLDMEPARTDEAILHLQQVIEIAPDSFLAEQAQGVLDTVRFSGDSSSPVATP